MGSRVYKQMGHSTDNSLIACLLVHLSFLALDDELFNEFNRRLKSRNASQYILRLKEMYVDFMGMCIVIIFLCRGFACKFIWDSLLAVESSVFTFDRPISFFHLFGSEERTKFEPELDALAKQVIIFFFFTV